MNLRDRSGAITPAEGCMFGAVILFVILLVAMLVIAFGRFRNPPMPPDSPPPPARGAAAPGLPGDRLSAWMALSSGVMDA